MVGSYRGKGHSGTRVSNPVHGLSTQHSGCLQKGSWYHPKGAVGLLGAHVVLCPDLEDVLFLVIIH